jgi:hypothetical protein
LTARSQQAPPGNRDLRERLLTAPTILLSRNGRSAAEAESKTA